MGKRFQRSEEESQKNPTGVDKAKKQKKKLLRCNSCGPCLRDDCGECESCKDKKKFGGPGLLKRSCIYRECESYQEVEVKPRRGRPPKKKKSGADSDASDLENLNDEKPPMNNPGAEEDDEDGTSSTRRKPRLQLNLSRKSTENGSAQPRIPKKRKKVEEKEDEDASIAQDLSDGEIAESPNGHKTKRQRNEVEHKSNGTVNGKGFYRGVGSTYISIDALRKKQSSLDGSFEASRDHYLKMGKWQLPEDIPNEKFRQVAKCTIVEIGRYDEHDLFANAVTENEAPGYFEIIQEPMDFGTMMHKVEDGKYELNANGMSDLYDDFLLIMDNCKLYNEDNDIILREAARVLGVLPTVYTEACAKARS